MLRKVLALALFIVGAVLIPAQVQYARKTTEIHAGVLLIDSWRLYGASLYYAYDQNGEPFVFYNLDQSKSVKPSDWSIVNPHGSTVMTDDLTTRWTAIQANVGGTIAPTGSVLTKADAPYWEVGLRTASDAELADYDILSMSVRGDMSLTPNEREKLHAYMDQGGTLWVDIDENTVIDPINGVPFAFDKSSGSAGPISADTTHPLLSRPVQISLSQVASMESDGSPGFVAVDPANYGAAGITPILETLAPQFDQMDDVASDTSGILLGVVKVGNGFMVVTARGVGTSLNRGRDPSNPTNNQFFAAKAALDEPSNAAAALVVNALNLGASYNESYFGSRKVNASPVDLHAPLMRQFSASLPLAPGNRNFVPPATMKGLFVISAFDRIYVYDGNPSNDLDGDGNPDDGVPDTDLSSGLDLLWVSAPMPGPISSPTCVTVSNPTGTTPRDQILVVDSGGTVHGFNAFTFMSGPLPPDLNNVAEVYNVPPPTSAADFDFTEDGRGPYAPTIHEGIAYIADTQNGVTGRVGRLWLMNPATEAPVQTGSTTWAVGGTSSTGIPEISGPATIGYIPIQDNSGGQDLVAYLPTRPNPAALGSPDSTAGITSMWLGAKGEKPQSVLVTGTSLEVTTRANLAGLKIYTGVGSDPLGIRVSVVRISSGIPLTTAEMASVFDGTVTQGPDGILDFGLVSGTWDSDYALRIDYRIDWGSGSLTLTDQDRRGSLFFPDAARTRRVIGSVALGANGNFFVSLGDQSKGGAVYAFREEGRGLFRQLYRYELYDAHTITLSGAAPINYRETFVNDDPVTSILGPLFQGPLSNLTLQGAPSVRNGLVFSSATATVGADNIPVTILMAFKEDPEPPKIPVGNLTSNFVLVQPDIARSVNPSNPEVFSLMQPSQFSYEAQGDNGYISMDNTMASRTGQVQQSLSASQAVILRQSGIPDKVIEPDAVGGRWSPLVWYTILEGTSTASPPMVTGNTVFVAGNSKLPDILSGVAPLSAVDRGVMFAMDADVQALPPDAYPNSVRPWMNQVPIITFSGTNIVPNESIRWPQTTGVTSFDDWKIRHLQTALKPGDTSFGVAAGDGALFTWGPTTVYGFTRGDLMIADEGRLLRLDASGNPLWSSDTSYGSGSSAQNTNSNTIRSLVRPVRAYSLGADQIVVADPASNRVVRMNLGGKEIRSVTSFLVDATFRPDGYIAGATPQLNAPSDIATYSTYVSSAQNFLSGASSLEYWVYYLIADSGNKRLIELVDRYQADPATREILNPVVDGSGVKQLGVLTWYSPANYTGKQFRYNSVARVYNPTTNKFVYAGGIGNATPASTDLGLNTAANNSVREANGGNGGVVLFDGAQTVVINSFSVPALNANVYYDFSAQTFSASAAVIPARTKSIGNVTSVTMRYVTQAGQIRLAVMFTDSSGVYEIYQPTVGADQPWVVRWMLPREMYCAMRRDGSNVATGQNPRDLNAMFARRLDSGEVIVVNGYLGKTRAMNPFTGEVLLLDGDFDPSATNTLSGFDFTKQNFGFSSLSIRLQLSQLSGIRNITAPVFADLK